MSDLGNNKGAKYVLRPTYWNTRHFEFAWEATGKEGVGEKNRGGEAA